MTKILIVDDDDDIRNFLNLHLSHEGYEVIEAKDGAQGIEQLTEHTPDLMIIDVMMPVMDGHEVCRHIHKNPALAAVYIIMLSAKGDVIDKITGLDTGADTYLSKPFNPDELKALVRAGLRTSADRRQAMYDALTGLFNRNAFNDLLARELAAFKRDGHPLSMVMVDLDHFKNVNDTYGHDVGDVVLKDLADIMRTVSRPRDLPCRWGGEEFAWLLPETTLENATLAAERLRQAIESHSFAAVGTLTASLGVVVVSADDDAETLCKRADQALYRAKDGGRNRVEPPPSR